jgi:hypothetical protein
MMWQTGKRGAMHVNVYYGVAWKYTVLLCRKGQMATLQRVMCIGKESEWIF